MQLNLDEFSSLMTVLPEVGNRFAVAVSGGADSLSLCLLAADWAKHTGRKLYALSVDHGLRIEAQEECNWVKTQLDVRGIEHRTLCWQGDKPTSDIQAQARKARYALMEKWCCQNNVQDLLLAHHQDDQAETFLLRLARGSGVDGLGAMKPVTQSGTIRLFRPLLNTSKQRLIEYLKGVGQDWIEDPSNQNKNFDRVKIRNAKETLSSLGLSADRLASTAGNMQRASSALRRMTNNWLVQFSNIFEEGYITLNKHGLVDQDDEILLRGLARIGMCVSGEIYPPRFDRLQGLCNRLKKFEDATLMGCRWICKNDHILVCRETRREDFPENIYRIDIAGPSDDIRICVLGQKGWEDLVKQHKGLRDVSLSKPVIYSLISFWDQDGVLAVPHLGYKRETVAFDVQLSFIAKNRLLT